jgi:hypothetical protein
VEVVPMRRALVAAVALGALAAVYATSVRRRMGHWGTQPGEDDAPLPGDDVVARPRYTCTRAVTVDAPPGDVWPWLVQIGQGRGGLYSYDWLENLAGLNMHSADRIVPELQDLAVGDEIRLVPPDSRVDLAFVVERLDPGEALVLAPGEPPEEVLAKGLPYATWAFVVRPTDGGGSRLLARFRSDFAPRPGSTLVNKYGLEPAHFVMERKMLLGIKQRAEKAAAERRLEAVAP